MEAPLIVQGCILVAYIGGGPLIAQGCMLVACIGGGLPHCPGLCVGSMWWRSPSLPRVVCW